MGVFPRHQQPVRKVTWFDQVKGYLLPVFLVLVAGLIVVAVVGRIKPVEVVDILEIYRRRTADAQPWEAYRQLGVPTAETMLRDLCRHLGKDSVLARKLLPTDTLRVFLAAIAGPGGPADPIPAFEERTRQERGLPILGKVVHDATLLDLLKLLNTLEAQKREAENPVNQDAQARVEARRLELEAMRVRDSIDAQRSRSELNREQWVSDSLANEARAAAVLDSLRRAGMQINSAEVRPMESPPAP